jgi:hypothetical protein
MLFIHIQTPERTDYNNYAYTLYRHKTGSKTITTITITSHNTNTPQGESTPLAPEINPEQ